MNDQAQKLRSIIESLKPNKSVSHVDLLSGIKQKNARVITITSGKGGVGKTNITINLAVALSELGHRVIIIDADFGLANIDVLFGIIPQYTLVDVIQNKKNILQVLSDGPNSRVKFISGGSGVEELVKMEKIQLESFVKNISMLDKISDIILVDTGAGLSDNVMSFVMAADEVLLITTPEPTALTDAYALIKMISNRDKNKNIKVLVNRAENIEEANKILNKLKEVTDKFLSIKISPLGWILQDDTVIRAVKQQQPFSISFPKSVASRQLREISKNLIESNDHMTTVGNNGIKAFVNKLVSFLSA